MFLTACLAILVIAVGATYAVAGRSLRAAPPASGTTTPSPLPSDLAMIWPPQVYFADAKHGYVVLKSCAGAPAGFCPLYLAVTTDGGLTWRARAVPGATTHGSTEVATTALSGGDADHLVLQPEIAGPAKFSANGGLGWTDLPAAVGTVEEVPPGGIAIIVLGRTGPGPDSVTVVRSDGVTAHLAHPPALAGPPAAISSQVGVAADGTLWILAITQGQPAWDYVSRDHGRTWFEVHGPTGASVLYGTSGPNLFAVDDQKQKLWTSKGGQQWDPVPLPATAGATHLRYEPQPDGSLLIGDPTQRRAYLAEGLHYTEVQVEEHMFADHVGTGCIKAVGPGAPFNLVSTRPTSFDVAPDCVHWGRLPFPVG